MSNFSNFMISFSTSCILLGFLYMICPQDTMSRSVKYVFCLCFLCCILSCVSGAPRINLDNFSFTSQSEVLSDQSAALTAQSVFEKALYESGINFSKIELNTNKLSDGSITINRVTVYTSEQESKVTDVIGSDSYEVKVINE